MENFEKVITILVIIAMVIGLLYGITILSTFIIYTLIVVGLFVLAAFVFLVIATVYYWVKIRLEKLEAERLRKCVEERGKLRLKYGGDDYSIGYYGSSTGYRGSGTIVFDGDTRVYDKDDS